MKVKTATPFVPGEIGDPNGVLRNFFDLQEKLIACVEQAGGLPVDKLKIRSPFDARVQYSVYSAFRILAAHERRHLRQAEQAAGARHNPAWGHRQPAILFVTTKWQLTCRLQTFSRQL